MADSAACSGMKVTSDTVTDYRHNLEEAQANLKVVATRFPTSVTDQALGWPGLTGSVVAFDENCRVAARGVSITFGIVEANIGSGHSGVVAADGAASQSFGASHGTVRMTE
jgi:hypothetical protein